MNLKKSIKKCIKSKIQRKPKHRSVNLYCVYYMSDFLQRGEKRAFNLLKAVWEVIGCVQS